MAEQSGLQGMVEKVDRGEQSGLHRLDEVDSAKQRVLQGLAGKVDRVDQLVVQRLAVAEHLEQGADGDKGQGLEHQDILNLGLGKRLWENIEVRDDTWIPATPVTRLVR